MLFMKKDVKNNYVNTKGYKLFFIFIIKLLKLFLTLLKKCGIRHIIRDGSDINLKGKIK